MASSIDKLIKELRNPDASVRKQAVKELGGIDHPRAMDGLISALRDQDWFVRLEAVKMLAMRREQRAAEPLKDLYFEATNRNLDLSIPLGFHEFVLAALKNLGWEVTYGGFSRKKK